MAPCVGMAIRGVVRHILNAVILKKLPQAPGPSCLPQQPASLFRDQLQQNHPLFV